ncbi:apoptotic chromatin condensation inducer in the nucleus-like isoform X2 [Panonychus citri]|uniref:apoptotic chromatin condensation inducer in the nucleus-like isoform X2 n=1 Tax=Panonychus citri TaxID=50023 RepID=UPI002307615A|nr:apoptotic chromatin condensation inducer in the nucleus-like isoform X2 [Panonychus citri]
MATESTTLEGSEKTGDTSPVTTDVPTLTATITTTPTPTITPTTQGATVTGGGGGGGAPPSETTSNILFIRNLVRPFTLVRLKELLEKTGKLVEDQFWIDKIKSKCYATYEKIEDAIQTRETLHGISWPDANPKKLIIEFATPEELEYHLNLDKNPPSSSSVPLQQQQQQQSSAQPLSSSSSRARTYSTKQDNLNELKESSKKEIINEKFDAVIRRGKLEKLDQGSSKDLKESNKQDRADKSEREKRPIREWDKEKFSHNDQPAEEIISPNKKKRANSASPEAKGRRNRDAQQHREKNRIHKESEEGDGNLAHKDDNAGEHESPAKLLDDLYKKTKATPCIYWLPLDEDQAKKRAELRAENLKKREEEMAAREATRKSRLEKQQRQRRRTPPPYERRERSPVAYKGREPAFNRRAGPGRGSYSGRRSQPSRLRDRRSRSRSSSVSRSRSRSRSYSRSRTRSSSRSRSRSVARKRSRSRVSRSPRRNGANYVRRSSRSRSRSPPPKRMVSPRRR